MNQFLLYKKREILSVQLGLIFFIFVKEHMLLRLIICLLFASSARFRARFASASAIAIWIGLSTNWPEVHLLIGRIHCRWYISSLSISSLNFFHNPFVTLDIIQSHLLKAALRIYRGLVMVIIRNRSHHLILWSQVYSGFILHSLYRVNTRLFIWRLLVFVFNSNLVAVLLLLLIWQVKQSWLVKDTSFTFLIFQIHQKTINVLHDLTVSIVMWQSLRSLLSVRRLLPSWGKSDISSISVDLSCFQL